MLRKIEQLAKSTTRLLSWCQLVFLLLVAGVGWTYPQDTPLLRIDYIWSRGLVACRSQVLTSGLSDHRAVRSEFAWPSQMTELPE